MRTCILLACAAGLAAQTSGPAFRAGLARADITPSEFLPMYGYANRKCGPANGIHDRLMAKALVLEAGGAKLALVTLDMGNIVSENLRRAVAEKLGIPVLLLAASHTHSGPQPPLQLGEIEPKVFEAVRQAAGSMFPARLGVGRGSLQLGYNRLLLREDGRARALFNNLERIPYGPVDPEYVVLRIDDASGGPKAVIVHYACHAVVLGPTNCKYSADFPGAMQAKVEAAMPGVQCMFVQGGAGDINPLFLGRKGNDDEDFAVVDVMGGLLAGEVLKTARPIRTAAPEKPSIAAVGEVLKFSHRWEPDKSLEVGITTVLINGEIGIAALPGEPHHRLQTYWKSHADVPVPLFYGYTYSSGGGWPGYIPDLRTAAYGGYGADVTTNIEIGAGERIMERHRINLYRLRGMWKDKPGLP